MCSACDWERESEQDEDLEDRNLATLTAEQDRAWTHAFNYYVEEEGETDEDADKHAWIDLVKEFPELAKFDGCRA